MLDDLLELGLDLAGEGAEALLGGSKAGKRSRPVRRTPKTKAEQSRPEPQAVSTGSISLTPLALAFSIISLQ